MRLLGLFEDLDGPSARIRFEAFRPALLARGVDVRVEEVPPGGVQRRRLLRSGREYDVVFLQRRLLPLLDLRILRGHARRLVFDFDDALCWRDRAPHRSLARVWKFRAVVRRADRVIAGSDELARLARARGAEPRVVPSTVSATAGGAARTAAAPVVLLWLGQPSTFRYLLPLAETLRGLLERLPGELRVVGAGPAARRQMPWARHDEWSEAQEAAALAEADLGLAPLDDDPWTRGKCGVRLLRYLAAGVPAVASPVGAQAVIAEQCGGTRTAGGGRGWVEAIQGILGLPDRGRELGRQASRRVAACYSPAAWEERFCTWVLGLGGDDPVAAGEVVR